MVLLKHYEREQGKEGGIQSRCTIHSSDFCSQSSKLIRILTEHKYDATYYEQLAMVTNMVK